MHGRSADYYRSINYARKHAGTGPAEDTIRRAEEAFYRCLADLPQPFLEEAFRYYADRIRRAETDELYDAVYHVGDVIDLLAREYDEQNAPLAEDEWQFLQELVSDHADQIDMETVSYIMGAALSGGHFHHGGSHDG
jgi:hypothetical protein